VSTDIRKTAAELSDDLASGATTSVEITQAALDRIAEVDGALHAFLQVDSEGALAAARASDERRAAGRPASPLDGVPIAVKDVLATKGLATTCGSRILEGWIPPYDATVVAKVRAAGLPILGKTNMDEFAMGSSTEHSAYGVTHNPWDLDRIPGGSGGGSAAAVASFEAPIALGTDTGGSIRQPGAVTGTVGVKPTYGGVSRYGLVALANSLDQVGPVTRTVRDAALLHTVIGGHDPKDSTSLDQPVPDLVAAVDQGATGDLTGVRIGVVTELGGDGYQGGVLERFKESVELLVQAGADVVEVSCPHFVHALATYYLILPAEASSNLARFDAMRYGLRVLPEDIEAPSAEDVMRATREAGFGDEVKRRIILGTYALSSGYYDAYYGQAQKMRTLISRDFEKAFEQADVLVSADRAHHGLPDRGEGGRPVGDVPQRPGHDPGQPVRPARHLDPEWAGPRGRPAGRLPDPRARAGRRPLLPGGGGAGGQAARAVGWAAARPDPGREGGGPMTTTADNRDALVPFDEVLERYDPALGLEVHVELNTATKMFCGCPAAFGGEPNTNVCPTCLGLPGSMPAVNRKAVESAIRIGLALNCQIAEWCRFAAEELLLPGHAEELPDLPVRRADLLRGIHGCRR
jgi:aspartyl-tRNA(Asn)/glutamyl-tRNA(Gln) amidotransferase subunit A